MATTETIHGQVSYVDENGNVHILNGETTAADVLVEKSTNKQAESGQSAIPSDVDTLQKLADRFGSLAFKSKISTSDIPENLVLDDFSGGNTSDTGFVSAKAGKDLDKRLKKYEGEDLVAVLNTDSYGAMLPQSEINDAFLSRSLTWSSNKINDQFIAMSNRTDGIAKELQQNNVSLSKQVSQLNSRINDMVSAGEQPGCQGDCAHCEQSETCCFNEIKDLRTICTDLEDRIKMLLAVEQAASSGSETVPETKGSNIR